MASRAFARMHPAVLAIFFASAIVLCMLARNPAFLASGLVLAAASYISIRGRAGWKAVAVVLAIVPIAAVFNAAFNPMGQTVLFEWLGARHFTLESLLFGAATGASFATALLWFGCLNRTMTADQFTYLFGAAAPALSLTLAMVMRFVPHYQRVAKRIAEARTGIGLDPTEGSAATRAKNSTSVLSALVTCALEGAVTTADSMRSRGYGCGRRTSFMDRSFDRGDVAMMALVAALDACVIACFALGGEATEYLPAIVLPPAHAMFILGLVAYSALSALPLAMNVAEGVAWRVSLSRI